MQNHEVSRIPLVTHRPFAKFATEPSLNVDPNIRTKADTGRWWRRD